MRQEFLSLEIPVNNILLGDALELLPKVPSKAVRTIHTSPPYNVGREYSGYNDSLPREQYLGFIRNIIEECFRVLTPGGCMFWQTGYNQESDGFIYPLDHLTYRLFLDAGFKLKDRIIWRYFGGMSFKKKFTNKHETILWWVKPGKEPLFNLLAIREKSKEYDYRNNLYGRNPGNVWEVDRVAFGSTEQTSHIAVFPEEVSDRIILATTVEGDLCLDPFSGSGTFCKVAKSRGREFMGFEIAEEYFRESQRRLSFQQDGEFFTVLSSIVKKDVFKVEGSHRSSQTISRKLKELLLRDNSEQYIRMFGENGFLLMTKFRDGPIDKKDKVNLWKATDEFFKSKGDEDDPIRIVDGGFLRGYKLHGVFNGPKRFVLAWDWLLRFNEICAGDEGILSQSIQAMAQNESGSFDIDGRDIILTNINGKMRVDEKDQDREGLSLFRK